jgi:hypothetical protein
MGELISKDIVDLQDIEKIQFLQTLQADPAKYSAYLAEKQQRILSEVVDTKRGAFVKVAGDAARFMDMDHNSQAAFLRTKDLADTQEQIIAQQAAMAAAAKQGIDTTRRQVEINNWYYENKRETLFVLQLVLLVMLTLVVILAAESYGWLPNAGAEYLMGFVIVVGAGTWLYRWYYTRYIRDPVFWNRRQWEGDRKHAPSSDQVCISA